MKDLDVSMERAPAMAEPILELVGSAKTGAPKVDF
jgi:hypothetical protein